MDLPSPNGAAIKSHTHVGMPKQTDYEGKFIVLSTVVPETDADELYQYTHGSRNKEQIWTYMGYGPFDDVGSMRGWFKGRAESKDPLFFVVYHRDLKRRVGMVSFLNIVPDMRRLELGHIWYAVDVQRSRANTEAIYLMLCEAFDSLKYRRVEWKCDSLNEQSRLAALRLGFRFEGIFRQHMIVKERNRDTAWYALLDNEWPDVKKNMELWLYQNPNQQLSLTELNNSNS